MNNLKEKKVPDITVSKNSHVRMLAKERKFNRGYEPNWTEEIYKVKKISPKGYNLEDLLGESIKGTFYEPEVQKISKRPARRYDIEKIVKYRGTGKKRQALIKWKGYGDKFNTWEPVKNIGAWRLR